MSVLWKALALEVLKPGVLLPENGEFVRHLEKWVRKEKHEQARGHVECRASV